MRLLQHKGNVGFFPLVDQGYESAHLNDPALDDVCFNLFLIAWVDCLLKKYQSFPALLNLQPHVSVMLVKHCGFWIVAKFRLRREVESKQRSINPGRIVQCDDSVGWCGLVVMHQCVNENDAFEFNLWADWFPCGNSASDRWNDKIESGYYIISCHNWMTGIKVNQFHPGIQIVNQLLRVFISWT